MKEMIYKESPFRYKEVLAEGIYKGYKYAIVSLGRYPVAYVKAILPAKVLAAIEVHGGITYTGRCHWGESIAYNGNSNCGEDLNSLWIGWDYAHPDDFVSDSIFSEGKKWTTVEVFDDVKNVIEQLIKYTKPKRLRNLLCCLWRKR